MGPIRGLHLQLVYNYDLCAATTKRQDLRRIFGKTHRRTIFTAFQLQWLQMDNQIPTVTSFTSKTRWSRTRKRNDVENDGPLRMVECSRRQLVQG